MKKTILPDNLKGVHIHFVGIKGTGMAALVEILYYKGAIITGSDVNEHFYTEEILQKLGLKSLSFSEDNITEKIQYVIYSAAYKLDVNPDLIGATKKNIPCILYSEALGLYSQKAFSCGICGVHGKTSTTGLTGTILKEIDLPSQVLAGSIIKSFGDTCTFTSPLIKDNNQDNNQKNIFVAETCEYQRHFMSFCPQKIILTSVESDHEDYYPTYESIRDAFVEYVCKLPPNGDLIYCCDDNGATEVCNIVKKLRNDINFIPYGTTAAGNFKLEYGKVENEQNSFKISLFNDDFFLKVPGKHEVMDAVAATALVCRLLESYNKNPKDYKEQIKIGLQKFVGGKRRSEIISQFKNNNGDDVIIIDDYGHHPTAIKTTLEGFRAFYKNRKIIVDFMSHTYSRTQALLDGFSKCFSSADMVILHKIYSSARENPKDFNVNGKTLYEETCKHFNKENVFYSEEILDAKEFVINQLNQKLLDNYKDGYLFITMGAGDNWVLGKEVEKCFR